MTVQLTLDLAPPRPQVRVRYRPVVRVEARCCNCGTRYSHWWGEHTGYPLCGTCAGVPEPRAS